MKKNVVFLMGVVMFITIGGCNKETETYSKKDVGKCSAKGFDMSISIDENVLTKNNPTFLSLLIENSSEEKLVLSESSFMLEFTSYSGSIKKTFYIDPFGDIASVEKLPYASLEIKANSALAGRIDLCKIIYSLMEEDSMLLPSDDYTVNLIINTRPDSKFNLNSGVVRSNYADVQITG